MLTLFMQSNPIDTALAEAECCRRDARAAVERDPSRAALKDKPSGWCVVTQKGFLSRAYHNMSGKDQLIDLLDRGHRVLLTVGIVAIPDAPLNTETHMASVRVTQPCKVSEYKLLLISARARLHAARALV
jgi:hypothetical protein